MDYFWEAVVTLESVMGLSATSALHQVYHADVGITAQPRMRLITWNPQAERERPQDGWLADSRQGIKWVTVQRRVVVAPEMKLSLKAFHLGGMYQKESPAELSETNSIPSSLAHGEVTFKSRQKTISCR